MEGELVRTSWIALASGGESTLDFDPAAWIALLLSILGLIVSILLRYLDGARVRVRVRPVLFNVGFGGTITYLGGKWPIPEFTGGNSVARPDRGEVIELAEIVIENCGRNPTTVYEIGFRWLGRRTHWWNSRVRHTGVPTPIRPPHQQGRSYAEGDQFRIEPSDVVTVLVNYWDLIRSKRPNQGGRIELRAAVKVAGRKHLKLSPWKLRWRIPDSAITSFGTATKIPVRAVVSKSIGLSLLSSKAETLGDIYFISRALESALDGQWSSDFKTDYERLRIFESDFEDHFSIWAGNWAKPALMFGVHRAIEEHKEVIDWSDISHPGLHKAFSKTAASDAQEPAASVETTNSNEGG